MSIVKMTAHISEESFRLLKVHAIMRSVTMSQIVEELITSHLKEWRVKRNGVKGKPGPRKRPHAGYIYFIREGRSRRIKIGFSKKPDFRITEFQTGSPHKLSIIGTIPGGIKKERELHKQFSPLRQNGEWFLDDGSIKSYIEEHCEVLV